MSRLLRLAQKFNSFYMNGNVSNDCKPFIVQGYQVGLIRPDVIDVLLQFPEVFHIHNNYVELNPSCTAYDSRSNAIDKVLRELRSKEAFITLKGWRDECYEVRTQFATNSLLKMDRSATCLFGIRNYGVDINGYVKHPTKGLCIWLQQRSSTKQTWPDKWDNMVGGGLSVGYNILDTAHKEAMEEASIPQHLLNSLSSAGCVSFFFQSERGIFPNTEFVFDLELPVDFVPQNADGEVQKFELLTSKECYERMFSSDFKTTSVPVVLDFLIRHGVVTANDELYYTEIVELLHIPLQNIYSTRNIWQRNQLVTELSVNGDSKLSRSDNIV